MASLEHLIREKLEAAQSASAFEFDMTHLLRVWREEVAAAGEDWTKLLGDRSYWEDYAGGGGPLVDMEVYLANDFTASPWVNQGSGGAAGNLTGTNVSASSGEVSFGATGYLSGASDALFGVGADEDVTLMIAGTFDFATRAFAFGTRAVTGATSPAGVSITFRNTGTITPYVANGSIAMGGASYNISALANQPVVITTRLYRATGRLKTRVNGSQVQDVDVAAIGTGALEAASTFNVGVSGTPAQGLCRFVGWARRALSDVEVAAIEDAYV